MGRILSFFLALFCLLLAPLSAADFYLTISTIFQNESLWLREWIEYHRLIGVDHFLLYNHFSTDDWQPLLQPYIDEGVVEVVEWAKPIRNQLINAVQIAAYNDGLKRLRGRSTWIAYIDTDEFLCPMECDHLREFLEEYEPFGGVVVNWKYFGTSGVDHLNPGELLIEKLTWAARRYGLLSRRVKSIVRPEYTVRANNAHRFEYIEGYYCVDTAFQPSIMEGGCDSERVHDDRLLLNHYYLRTREWAYGEKLRRAIQAVNRTHEEQMAWTARMERESNLEEDLRIQRFVPALRARMGL